MALCCTECRGNDSVLLDYRDIRRNLDKLIEVSVHLMLEEHTLWEGVS